MAEITEVMSLFSMELSEPDSMNIPYSYSELIVFSDIYGFIKEKAN